MILLNQSGTGLYNFENVVCVSVDGCYIKVTLSRTIHDQLPSIAIADYSTSEKAKAQFDKFVAKASISSKGIYQFPKENKGETKCESV